MNLQFSKTFVKDYQKLPKQIIKQVREKFNLLNDYGFIYPSLRFKHIKKYQQQSVFELSITMNYRVILQQMTSQKFRVLRVGTHNILNKL